MEKSGSAVKKMTPVFPVEPHDLPVVLQTHIYFPLLFQGRPV
jgi:hypothetical protein